MKIYFPTMENLFSCDGNFSFIQWYQNNVPNRNFLHTGRRGVPLRYCIDGANRVRITGLREYINAPYVSNGKNESSRNILSSPAVFL